MLTSRILSPSVRSFTTGASKSTSASCLGGKAIVRIHKCTQQRYSRNVRMAAQEDSEAPSVNEEWKTFEKDQKSVARLTWAECSRSLIEASGCGVLANISNQRGLEGFPRTSYAIFVPDDSGRPIFGFTTLSPRTREVVEDGRCSLIVMEKNTMGISNRKVSMSGIVKRLEGEEADKAKQAYLAKKPDALFLNFGDFGIYRMEEVKSIFYAVNIGIGGGESGEVPVDDYISASVDPVYQFSPPICKHMNEDHAETLPLIIKHYTGLDVDSAMMIRLDRLGFEAHMKSSNFSSYPCRIQFPSPAMDRKQVREAIVEMTRTAAAASQHSQ